MSRTVGVGTVRLSAFYAAFFAVVGVQQPFWPVWLASHGLDAAEIGITLAISLGIKALSAPLAAHFADRSGERRRPVLALVATALAAFCLFGFTTSFWPIVLVSLIFYSVWPPVMSLVESLTVIAAHAGRLDYGRVRLWGSISYIAVAVLAGEILVQAPPSAVFWTALACIAATALACAWLPDLRAAPSIGVRLPLFDSLGHGALMRTLIACALIQGSHAVYYAFATLHWQALGYSELVIGMFWGEGVIAEIVLFAFGTRIIARTGARALIAAAGLACGARWLVTAFAEDAATIAMAQLLHALSFGAAHLGAMAFIGRSVAPSLSATAQSLYSGLVWGVGLGLMLLASGWLYTWFEGRAFLAMAMVGLAGAAVAWPLIGRRPPPPSG